MKKNIKLLLFGFIICNHINGQELNIYAKTLKKEYPHDFSMNIKNTASNSKDKVEYINSESESFVKLANFIKTSYIEDSSLKEQLLAVHDKYTIQINQLELSTEKKDSLIENSLIKINKSSTNPLFKNLIKVVETNSRDFEKEKNINLLYKFREPLQSENLIKLKCYWKNTYIKYLQLTSESLNDKLSNTNRKNRLSEEHKGKLNKLKISHDDISGVTWFKNTKFKHYRNDNKISLYIGTKENDSWLRMKISYSGSDWIFFEKVYLSYNGNTKEIPFNFNEKKTNVGSGYKTTNVSEGIDLILDKSLIPFLKEISKSKESKIRLKGKYTQTRKLKSKEKKAILEILKAYEIF